jgi:hypothetical protein
MQSPSSYKFGGYADYFSEMERLEQFVRLSPRRAATSLFSNAGGQYNATRLHTSPDVVRSTNPGVLPAKNFFNSGRPN